MPGEFELIARLAERLPLSRRTILGAGDDCAILAPSRGPGLFTIDSVVEGVHFDLRWSTPEALGARALAVNLSDIAAMGGRPRACVVNVAIRRGLTAAFFDRLYAGLKSEARAARIDVVGGNITRARELAITIAVLGDAGAQVLRRDAARIGDEIFVTGTLGDAAVGWRILSGKIRAPQAVRKFLVGRFIRPTARLMAGERLASIRPVPAAIDISDGVMQDLGHILERSGVGAELDARALPLSPAYRAVMGGDLSLALGGGEDYELLFCIRPGYRESVLARRLRVGVHRIGRIVRGKRLRILGADAPRIAGFDQLRARA
ncbi:MAG TPA: thiamine-phosphate kinase [Candidatus Binataceae bacterium]